MTILGALKRGVFSKEENAYIMKNGAHYAVLLENDGPITVLATLRIDGRKAGTFVFEPNMEYPPIERPARTAKKFTFYTVRAVKEAKAKVDREAFNPGDVSVRASDGAKAVARCGISTKSDCELNGLVECAIQPVEALKPSLSATWTGQCSAWNTTLSTHS